MVDVKHQTRLNKHITLTDMIIYQDANALYEYSLETITITDST